MLIMLFGLAGSGKNYVGEILANKFGYYYWDADQALSKEMHDKIDAKELFTQAMRDDLTAMIIKKIAELKKDYPNIVISQALYKEKNRHQLCSACPDIKLIQVKTTDENLLARLKQRNNEIDRAYAEKMRQHFEEPRISHEVIINDGDAAVVIQQLQIILNSKVKKS